MTTKRKGDLSSGDGYDNVDTEELQALLRLARQTTFSLETELAARSSSDELPTSINNCVEKIRATLHDLNIMHRLDDAAGLMSTAAKVIQSEHDGWILWPEHGWRSPSQDQDTSKGAFYQCQPK